MNFKTDLIQKHQNLLQQMNYKVENREYSQEEIRQCVNVIGAHIMSKSSKNGDLSKELNKFDELVKILAENEK